MAERSSTTDSSTPATLEENAARLPDALTAYALLTNYVCPGLSSGDTVLQTDGDSSVGRCVAEIKGQSKVAGPSCKRSQSIDLLVDTTLLALHPTPTFCGHSHRVVA